VRWLWLFLLLLLYAFMVRDRVRVRVGASDSFGIPRHRACGTPGRAGRLYIAIISDGNAMGLVRSPGGRCPVTAAGHTARRTAVTAPLSCAVLWSRQHSGGAARVWRGRPNTYTYDTALPCALRSVVRQSRPPPPIGTLEKRSCSEEGALPLA